MSANPKSNRPDPEEQVDLWIAEREQKYGAMLDGCRLAAETTKTEAWKANYSAQTKAHRDAVKSQCTEIDFVNKRIISADTSEDDEKSLKECVKALADERGRYDAWRARAIAPYEIGAKNAQEYRSETIANARRDEKDKGLIYHGLGDAVTTRVKSWPIVSWDDIAGLVSVEEA